MITTRYVDVAFCGGRSSMARALYQYDYGQILRITDLDLPVAYEVHFAEGKTGNSVTQIGNADGVNIPDAMLLKSGSFYAWFYLHETASDGETRYEILFPVMQRAKPTNQEPTPVQQDAITEAIAALNAAVEQTGADVIAAGESASAAADSADEASGYASDASASAINAGEYAEDAQGYASSASESATAAGNAQTAAETAQGKAETAQGKAEDAQTAAEAAAAQTALDVIAAGQSANAAAGYANTASGYASDASGYATAAQGYANDASGYASSASGYATNAYNSATAAAGSAGEASGYATTASGYASAANDAKIATQGAQTAAETAQGLAEAAQTGAEAAQTAAETARDAAIAATEDKAPVILDSASGAIVSITDGANGMNARSLVAAFSPIQSGSGDPSPDNIRPISGRTGVTVWNDPKHGGTILWNQLINPSTAGSTTVNGVTFTSDGNGSIEVSGTASATASLAVTASYPTYIEGHKYYICGCPAGGANNKYSLRYNSNGFGENGSGAIVTAVSGSAANGQIKVGTQYPGVVVANGTAIRGTITFRPQIFDLTEMFGAGNEPSTVGDYRALFPHDYYAYDSGTQTCVSAVNGDPYGLYPVSWQDEAGTVYGGTVDVVSGVLTVDRAIKTYNQNNSWTYSSNWSKTNTVVFYSAVDTSVYYPSYTYHPVTCCDKFIEVTRDYIYAHDAECVGFSGTVNNASFTVRIDRTRATDKASFLTWLESNPITIVYELATPQTYQLTPTQVQMLIGANNVWATGDSVSLTYPCDTRLYIERLTEPTEDDMTANANIPTNTFFMVGNRLFKSTAAIAQGAAIVVGTNCTALSLADALNALN